MYAAVPSITPIPVIIAGDVIVGDAVTSEGPAVAPTCASLREAEVQHLHRAVGRAP